MSTWKSLSSAPRDGSEILICYPHQPGTYQLISYSPLWKQWIEKGSAQSGLEQQGCLWTELPRWPNEYRDEDERQS